MSSLLIGTGETAFPIDVLDERLRVVHRGFGDGVAPLPLDPGLYVVIVRAPGHLRVEEAVRLGPDEHRELALAPPADSVVELPHRRPEPHTDISPRQPRWAYRFLRLDDLMTASATASPRVTDISDRGPERVIAVQVPDAGRYFLQVAEPGEVPLNVALPTAAHREADNCIVVVRETPSTVHVQAFPGPRLAALAARYLAALDFTSGARFMNGDVAQGWLARRDDPIGAVLAGYLFLRAGGLGSLRSLVPQLADLFDWLPDAAVLAGELEALSGDHIAALGYFLLASQAKGLPLMYDGLSILVTRLREYASASQQSIDVPSHQLVEAREVCAGLEQWAPFVELGTSTLTLRSSDISHPGRSQHPVEIGADFFQPELSAGVPSEHPGPELWEPPRHQVVEFPRFNRLGLRAARTRPLERRPVGGDDVYNEAHGVRLRREEIPRGRSGSGDVAVVVEVDDGQWAGRLLRVEVVWGPGPGRSSSIPAAGDLHLVLLRAHRGGVAGRLTIRDVGAWVGMSVTLPPLAVEDLTAASSEAVTRSLLATNVQSRAGWRAVVRRLPPNHPAREVVGGALGQIERLLHGTGKGPGVR